jgi:hypothetical protein
MSRDSHDFLLPPSGNRLFTDAWQEILKTLSELELIAEIKSSSSQEIPNTKLLVVDSLMPDLKVDRAATTGDGSGDDISENGEPKAKVEVIDLSFEEQVEDTSLAPGAGQEEIDLGHGQVAGDRDLAEERVEGSKKRQRSPTDT